MKTTVAISDPLLREARELAAREGVTLRTLVERGLIASSLRRRVVCLSGFVGPASRAKGCSPNSAKHRGIDCAI